MRRSRGAHLVSISMISTFTPRRACTRSSQIALFSRDCAQKRELWTSPTNWLHAQFDRACNQLVGSGLVGRTPTAIALQSGSEGNRHKTSDPNHLRLDPVAVPTGLRTAYDLDHIVERPRAKTSIRDLAVWASPCDRLSVGFKYSVLANPLRPCGTQKQPRERPADHH